MKLYRVHCKWPSGYEMDITVKPGSPLAFHHEMWKGKQAIDSIEQACNYCMGAMVNKIDDFELEYPIEVTPVEILEPDAEWMKQQRAAVKATLLKDKPVVK